jgi:tagatose 6-phosphate kinase
VLTSAGGKGLNVARSAQLCGQPVVVTGFVAGFAGDYVIGEVIREGMTEKFVRVAGETRTCINIIDEQGRSTELLEPGVTVTEMDLTTLVARFAELLPQVEVVTLSGSAPAGCPDGVYVPLIQAARQAGKPVILDTSGALLAAGLAARPNVVKPNREELAALVGAELSNLPSLVAAGRELCTNGPEWVVVSLGGDGAVAISADRAVQVVPPPVAVANAVGCGDVLVGGLATGLANGLAVDAALPLAVRVAAAAAAHPQTGRFDPAYAETLSVQVRTL